METYLPLDIIIGVGREIAGLVKPLGYSVLAPAAAFACAFEYFAMIAPGEMEFRNFLKIFVHLCGLILLLKFYDHVVHLMTSLPEQITHTIAQGDAFNQFMNHYSEYWQQASKSEGGFFDQVKAVATGALNGVLHYLSALIIIIVIQGFFIIRAMLLAFLYAIGPLAIGFSILPGRSGLLSRWVNLFIVVAGWQIVGAIFLEMIARAGLKQLETKDAASFVALITCNVVLVLALVLVPKISAELIGQAGIGNLGSSLLRVASDHIGIGGSLARYGFHAGAAAGHAGGYVAQKVAAPLAVGAAQIASDKLYGGFQQTMQAAHQEAFRAQQQTQQPAKQNPPPAKTKKEA